MEKIELEVHNIAANQSQRASFKLLLKEKNGERIIPIVIGAFEAQAIAIKIENIKANRPLTHDLFKSLADKIKFSVDEIMIDKLTDGIFFAKICCSTEKDDELIIDSRPSDAIAIALRFNAPIFALDTIMEEVSIIIEPSELKTEIKQDNAAEKVGVKTGLKDYPTKILQKKLDDAVANEEYEKASEIRDELNKRS